MFQVISKFLLFNVTILKIIIDNITQENAPLQLNDVISHDFALNYITYNPRVDSTKT